MTVTEATAIPRAAIQEADDPALERFRADLAAGRDWFEALLDAVAAWTTPQETFAGRRFRYLIGGEAFDWLLLAERLLLSVPGLVPRKPVADFLLTGRPPRPLSDTELRARIGETKYAAVLNLWYGVRVEEALIMAVEEDMRKARVGLARHAEHGLDDAIHLHIYGRALTDLLVQFAGETGQRVTNAMTLDEHDAFVYWLFKHRVKSSDKARLASDTKRALRHLNELALASGTAAA